MEQFKPNKNLISASAGTGKTYTLIQEIDRVLQHTEPKKVVAITFTRAATRDLRAKVHLDDLNINTIHGFFTGILREQSLYFKNSTGFNILEEFDDKALFKDVASTLLLKKIENSDLESFFAEYDFENVVEMLQKIEARYAIVRNNITTDLDQLFQEEKKAEYEKLKELFADLEETVTKPILTLAGASKDKLEEIRRLVSTTVSKLTPVTDMDSFYKNIALLNELPQCAPGSNGSLKNWNGDELSRVKVALKTLNEIRKDVTEFYRLGEEWITKEAAQNRKKFMELFLQVHDAYMQKKKELDVLSYNDIELFTYDLVKKNPWVASFYREKYDHIFVDEFQDTNKMQRDVLLEISKELFLVGDSKQSIYRFRNADVRVFMDTQANCAPEELKVLTQNRRCLPQIIETVNQAFPQIFGHSHSGKRKDFEAEYLEFLPYRDQGRGIVRFINAPATNTYHNSFNHKLEAQICLDIINDRLNSGKTYQDIAILFRSSAHMGEFEKLFRENGVPFVVYGGSSRGDLTASLKSLFKVILDPYDDYSMLEVLKLPYFYMSDQEIYALKQQDQPIWTGLKNDSIIKDFILEMRQKKDHGSFTEFVAQVLRVSKFIHSASLLFTGQEIGAEETILKAARHVESEGQGIEYFVEFISSMKEESAGSNIDAVKLMTVHASKGLEFNTVFLPCLDVASRPSKESIVISEDGDIAVKLGDDESNKKINTVRYYNIKDSELEADIAESKRVFYVAMTRAKDELYLISDFNKGKDISGDRWVDWIAGIFKDRVEEYPIEQKADAVALRRKVVRTVSTDRDSSIAIKAQRRWTVSQIKETFNADLPVGEGSLGQKGVGTIVHSILENWQDADAVEKIYQGIGDAALGVRGIVDSFVSSELGKKIFSADKFLLEHSFAVKINGDIVSGRIDRINIYNDHVWIIDYKTGLREQELESYKAQLYCYLCFAQAKFKDKKVSGSIVDIIECKDYTFDLKELSNYKITDTIN